MAKHSILILNGPNLNLLGSREPEIYGHATLNDIMTDLRHLAESHSVSILTFQSNAEHELINHIHQAKEEGIKFIIINPGAFTHTSIALRDALLGVNIPFIEVHLSNIFAREEFRSHSFLSDVAKGVITGLGDKGYKFSLLYAIDYLNH